MLVLPGVQMLRQEGEKDSSKHKDFFRAAFFGWQKATESVTEISNTADTSAKGVQSRSCMAGLLPLRQQLAILTSHIQSHEEDSAALGLLEETGLEYVFGAIQGDTVMSDLNAASKLSSYWSSIKVVHFEPDN